MSKKYTFSYCLLQYRHNPWLKERMNIGVLMYAREASFLRLAVRGWDGRVTSAYPDIDKAAFTEDLKQITRAVDRFSRENVITPNLLSETRSREAWSGKANDAMHLASLIAHGLDSSYTWAEGGVGLCTIPENRLAGIFQRFVAPFDREKSPVARSDDQVWSGISKLIVERKLIEKMEFEPKIQTDLGPIKFQAGYQNGRFHAIQPLSFDLADEDRISAKAGKWSGFATAVKAASGKREVVTQFVVGRPSKDSLLPTYRSTCTFLRSVVGTDNVIEERNSGDFVDRIEDDIRNHPIQ
ncbi:DUF3037 domain-containing protein [Celeribacter baekdonensis]|uniref:DUF3037 domain-containing protein n=1 Tax=Celeribacter baekdonensis B30 TaxID=1208323 RepID=K2IIK5_9RHOB|nr:DUF3037 domain-containing protein [Celeribacter baekdonensis]EKE69971.1 hypothetical protein B30_13829 [Celeribacter baekdonensis B30]